MSSRSRGSILVGLLWCLTLLAIIVIGVLYSSRLDLKVTRNLADRIQARYLAVAGVEKAKALLHQDLMQRQRSRRVDSGALANAPEHFRDVRLGRGSFRVFHLMDRDHGSEIRHGIRDEESLLNINEAAAERFTRVPGMTPELIAALIDFRDEDETPRPGGAEADHYMSLRPPYLPRNGPFETIRELLRVRGFTPELLLGEDRNANGILDGEEDDGEASDPADDRDHQLDSGIARHFTVHSSVRNLNAAGETRIDVQTADETTLATVSGISADIAKALVAYRNQNRLGSLDDLLDVVRTNPRSSSRPPADPAAPALGSPPSAEAFSGGSGEKLISQDLLLQIADDITVTSDSDQPGLINVNTAGVTVLQCLPGVELELANAVVAYRNSSGAFQNVAWLLRVPGMTRQIFKPLAPMVTVRSETFRILSEGTVASSGVSQRLEVVVRLGAAGIDTLAYREDL